MTTAAAGDTRWEQLWLPLWPLASDDFTQGVYRMARGDALQRRYVEANPHALSNLLVVDIDHPDAALRALATQGNHPMPTALVENPRNGHAHAVWALTEPVTRTEYGSRKATAYAAAVVEGLRRAVDGDAGYSGLMTKNPTHDAWHTLWLGEQLRSLNQLEADLGPHMPPPRWRETTQHRTDPIGLGRNCTLFETARHWAYRELRNHWGNPHTLATAIHTEVQARNASFSEPLPLSEARAIAASIHRWITTRSRLWNDGPTVYEATFSTIQSHRGRRSRATVLHETVYTAAEVTP
ncbi:MAG: replication initiation protein [Methyloceanibacter sp.]